MNDHVVRTTVRWLTGLAALAILIDAPAAIRIPIVVTFALVAPGLALTRSLPALSASERLSMTGALSLTTGMLVTLGLLAIGTWSSTAALLIVALVALVGSQFPSPVLAEGAATTPDPPAAPSTLRVLVLDVTREGAIIAGPADQALPEGARLPVRIGGDSATIEIRHAQPAHDGVSTLYGVSFVDLSDRVRARLPEKHFGSIVLTRPEPATQQPS